MGARWLIQQRYLRHQFTVASGLACMLTNVRALHPSKHWRQPDTTKYAQRLRVVLRLYTVFPYRHELDSGQKKRRDHDLGGGTFRSALNVGAGDNGDDVRWRIIRERLLC